MLTERERDILLKVTELYIRTGEPVGSRTVQKVFNMKISPATIRNVMADLEEKGFLYQPHTSAGRIPTDKGLKVYITHQFFKLGEEDKNLVNQLLNYLSQTHTTRTEDILVKLLDFLQNSTGYLGIGASFLEKLTVKEINLIKISKDKALLIIAFYPDYIVHKVINLSIPEGEIAKISKELSVKFKNKPISKIKKELVEELNSIREEFAKLSFKLNSQILSALNGINKVELYGTSNIVNILADDIERLKNILEILEEKNLLLDILTSFLEEDKETNVILGSETKYEALEPFGIVVSRFQIGDKNGGVIGIIGPKRMDYSKIIPTVENVAKAFTIMLNKQLKK
ncbi:heat-inducible transcription repressor HrcA [Desulfurobacterium pacificum]|jgi:heat-inducible transcriptional repressor|uniref:Heat-inducible transcription repressor HrcA n=1 Tax=Desulfurobacterium pacificum TaxID=240166 RepID=A0ABY1NGM9_9BACT|nr:heat-inducible transcriptional repressor HrcA [Desulfurobacterium pacificum]SMP08508.1 heat-inducible transcription repressor HrcA [Desulfurobacterium pacificum]